MVEQLADYDRILLMADSTEYISEKYYYGCMKARNARLVELADCCVCYYDNKKSASGTGQTVRMAERKNICIIKDTLNKSTFETVHNLKIRPNGRFRKNPTKNIVKFSLFSP